jgi:hypothetical protein
MHESMPVMSGYYIIFEKDQRGITPGQFAAWYDGDELLGSGAIDEQTGHWQKTYWNNNCYIPQLFLSC